jgi:hypothetical protein
MTPSVEEDLAHFELHDYTGATKHVRDRQQRLPKGICDYLGYTLLVGRKPARE